MAGVENSKRARTSPVVTILGMVLLVALGAVLALGAERLLASLSGEGEEAKPEVGFLAPEIVFKDLEGQEVRLSDFKGQLVLLNFRTTWCGYCRAEAPQLQSISEEMPDVAVLGINIDESPATVEAYSQELGLTFPMFVDDSGNAANAYEVRGIPSSFFIDSKGRIIDEHLGPLSLEIAQAKFSGEGS